MWKVVKYFKETRQVKFIICTFIFKQKYNIECLNNLSSNHYHFEYVDKAFLVH